MPVSFCQLAGFSIGDKIELVCGKSGHRGREKWTNAMAKFPPMGKNGQHNVINDIHTIFIPFYILK
jgi:hypothetical protein